MLYVSGRIELERGARTILELLSERMDGVDRAARRPSLRERLGLKGLGCCGATWGLGPTTISVRDDEEEENGSPQSPLADVTNVAQDAFANGPTPPCVIQSPATTGMNLATALAAERQLRAGLDPDNGGAILSPSPPRPNSNDERSPPSPATARTAPETPSRVSLMRLLEETDGYDGEMKKEDDGGEGCDSMCCVCMGRKKGAAFIPCGHTFCRVCSRELWLNRGSCPLCNRPIIEILDIY